MAFKNRMSMDVLVWDCALITGAEQCPFHNSVRVCVCVWYVCGVVCVYVYVVCVCGFFFLNKYLFTTCSITL